MSGICGIYNLDGRPADSLSVARMTNAVAHRGPDGISQRIAGPVAFAHLQLQTTPESFAEKQPVNSDDGFLCLTFDGRIDNRNDLKSALTAKNFPARDDADADLVLRAYQCWGEDCPIHLLGDFAFAIWDGRHKSLFCARDYVGVRPFSYHHSKSLFAFGSEIRAVIALDAVPRRLNEYRLADYLVESLDRDDTESTFYQDVFRLPAGHCLTVAPGRFYLRDYWQLQSPPTLKLSSVDDYGAAFKSVFVEAVRARLRSSHRVGSTLSGGIDSSSVVCTIHELLRNELKEPLHTISLVDADHSKCGETPYIQEVLRGGWLVPRIFSSNEVFSLEKQLADADEPFEGGYFFNWFIFSAAQQAGIRVLLDGVSGDHITAPYNYLSILLRSFNWKTLAQELSYKSRVYQEPIWRNLLLHGFGPLLPNPGIKTRKFLRKYRASLLRGSLINPRFAAKTKIFDRSESLSRSVWKASQNVGTLHAWSFASGILPFFFEQTGRIAATMGIEPRHPFVDRRVIEFFLSLPLKVKTFSPLPKRVIRAGMHGIVPEMVRSRAAFAHPGSPFLSALASRSTHLLEPTRFNHALESLEEYVNVDEVLVARAALFAGDDTAKYALWEILCLSLWLGSKQI